MSGASWSLNMANATSSTPFPLGAYLGNPDNSNAANEATFESLYQSFTGAMGTAPSFFDTYVDQTQSISDWVGNSDWAASSAADSADAKTMTPVIALPMSSSASGSLTPDQSYQAFASGQYDSVLQGIVQAWASSGFTNLVFRPGWEMNIQGPTYAGSDAQSQADWVSAFQHIYTVLHQAAAADGVNVQVVWNPSVTNYTDASATTALYPGNNFVDVIGADAYSDIHPYSDGGATPTYHDWDTGQEDTSVSQFIADPVNRDHYWSDPAATEWSNDSSGGHSQSLDSLIQFAEQQGKPFAIPETGAGNSNAGTDVADDAAYPQWLAAQLTAAQAAGEPIDFVNLWDSNGGGNYQFSYASDGKPAESAAWAQYFGATQSVTPPADPPPVSTAGPDTLDLQVSEDAWQGDAQFTVAVNGQTIGGTYTATAAHATGATQDVAITGNWGTGAQTVGITFINDAYGGSSTMDRNLYVDGVSYNGQSAPGTPVALMSNGTADFTTPAPTVPTALTINLAEDAWQGDAQYSIAIDGQTLVQDGTATASHALGQSQAINLTQALSPGTHDLAVSFLNDAYGGTAQTDRNLYVNSAAVNGSPVSGASAALMSTGTDHFQFVVPS
jgi:beta-mannanase